MTRWHLEGQDVDHPTQRQFAVERLASLGIDMSALAMAACMAFPDLAGPWIVEPRNVVGQLSAGPPGDVIPATARFGVPRIVDDLAGWRRGRRLRPGGARDGRWPSDCP
jgi:hypothetical protein